MTFFEILHKLILGPIELLFDVIFSFCMQMTQNPVLSIVVLSLAINLLVLPLYKKADALQKEEHDLSLRMKPDIDHIKKTFSGDERFMVLQIYYRQNNYKPYYVLRGSLSLLLQIPFFMAAYNFLSGLRLLQGVSFGPITNLAAPDGILRIGTAAINILPILMTLINIVSGLIYTRGQPLKSKIQLYGMALVFLALLYNSPAGLVFYWTLNNLFSLGKNIFNKLPNPKKVLRIACSCLGIAMALLMVFRLNGSGTKKVIWGIGISLLLQLPMITYWIRKKYAGRGTPKIPLLETTKTDYRTVFFVCCILLTIVTGLLIPSAVIHASPAEFVEKTEFRSPLIYVLHAFLLAAGFFMVWCVIYYLLSDESGRSHFSKVFAILAVIALVDYMFFGKEYGNMSSTYMYDTDVFCSITASQKAINAGVLFVLVGLIWFLFRKKPVIVKAACILACLVTAGMSAANIISTAGKIPEIEHLAEKRKLDEDKVIHLSRNGKNVVVFMLDRAIGYYAPFIFEEKPELKEQFAGFVCYPNTLSYGNATNVGTPPLFGGYEYMPEKMNQRSDVLLKDKQNEALKLMPLIFRENGYEVTVCDPPYANYSWIPDLSIYDDYPDIRTFITEGQFGDESDSGIAERYLARERNLFCYSIFRISPVMIQSELYDNGNYNKTERLTSTEDSEFLDNYLVLKSLPYMTLAMDKEENTFLMFVNGTTHMPLELQEPEYEPKNYVNNAQYDLEHLYRVSADGRKLTLETDMQKKHYQVDMAAMLQMGKWMDDLREKGVYDNTRMIIVADHGYWMEYPEMMNSELKLDPLAYNPLFMVKDFSDNDELRFSNEFMTNADTPVTAFSGLVENPVNPFTWQPVTDLDKGSKEQKVCDSPFNISVNNGYTFANSHYYILKNHEVLNPENWSEAE